MLITVLALIMVNGCQNEQSIKRSIEQSWHQKLNWCSEDYFTDSKVIELCRAIEKENLTLIDKLIAEGADVNAIGKGNMTPLLWAYPKNNLEVFIKILEAGADPNVQVTSDFGTECFIGFKEFYIGVGMSVTEKSATTRFPGYLKAVIKHGGDPNLVSKYHNMNNTPLHCVIDAVDSYDIYDIMESVEILLDAGADIDAVTYRNETPLVLAVRGGRYDVAILLVENGADWEIMPDGGFFTVVHDVISIKEDEFSFPTGEAEESYNKLVTLLKEKGADFDEARDDIKLFKSLFADPAKTTEGEYRRKQKESAQIREQLIKERHERYERKKRNGSAPMPFGSGPFFRRSLVVPLSCPVGVMRSRRVLRDVRGRNRRRRFPRRAA